MSKSQDGDLPTSRSTVRTDRCLLVFSKPARPGRVKTRLIGELSAEQAAELHGAFLADVVEEMTAGRFALRMAWALAADESAPDDGIPSLAQHGSDLGERLYGALSETGDEYPLVAAIGSDHPHLRASLVESAFDKLNAGTEVVLGPAGDGGYYLVAVRREALRARLFEAIPWSTDGVLRTTLERCGELGLGVELLPLVMDVDTPGDLEKLVADLERDAALTCGHTRALLKSWGRLEALQGDGRRSHFENP